MPDASGADNTANTGHDLGVKLTFNGDIVSRGSILQRPNFARDTSSPEELGLVDLRLSHLLEC